MQLSFKVRTVDLQVVARAEHIPVSVAGNLANGWNAGMWAKMYGNMQVDLSTGNPVTGFLLKPSEDKTDGETYMTSMAPAQNVVTLCFGGWICLFKYFEVNNAAERATPGSGAALSYSLDCPLYVSNRGYLTCELENSNNRQVGQLLNLPQNTVADDGTQRLLVGVKA